MLATSWRKRPCWGTRCSTNPLENPVKTCQFQAKDKRFDEAFVGESERLEVAVALRTLRETEGLTLRQLAEKVEKPQSTIARIENGNMNVTFKTMNDIAKAFDKVIEVKFV